MWNIRNSPANRLAQPRCHVRLFFLFCFGLVFWGGADLTFLSSDLRRRRRVQQARQRRLHRQLAMSQLRGTTPSSSLLLLLPEVLSAVSLKGSGFPPPPPSVPQGSYHCGTCKTGFTGDQVKGCKPEISCGNSLTNPCDVNAQCIPERDGSITCQVPLPRFCFWPVRPLGVPQGPFSRLLSVESAGLVTGTCAGRTRTSTVTPTRS